MGLQVTPVFFYLVVLVSIAKLFPMSMNYSYNKISYKNENTNEWTCCINMLNTCTLIAWWSSNAKHIAVGKENREKLKEQQNQHNKHHIKANGRKQMRNYLQKMLKSAVWLANWEPSYQQAGYEGQNTTRWGRSDNSPGSFAWRKPTLFAFISIRDPNFLGPKFTKNWVIFYLETKTYEYNSTSSYM